MILETTIILLSAGTWYKVSKRKVAAGMTAERKLIFDNLINQPHEPKVFREMADVFEKNGLTDQATLLRKRAKLRELSPDVKAAHKQAFRDGMKSTDPAGILMLAKAFELQGATGNAQALRTYAANLKTAQAVTPPPAAPPPAAPAANATAH